MPRVFYTSDSHFDHEYVARMRGFRTKEDHDRAIIANWNRVVRPEDTVTICGDAGMGRYERFADQLSELNGTIDLILGNHDKPFGDNQNGHLSLPRWMEPQGRFRSVAAYGRRKVGSYQFLLSHFPYYGDSQGDDDDRFTQYRLRDEGAWLVHGHIHQPARVGAHMRLASQTFGAPPSWRGRQLHVGLDAWRLTPVSQEQVIEEMAKAELR